MSQRCIVEELPYAVDLLSGDAQRARDADRVVRDIGMGRRIALGNLQERTNLRQPSGNVDDLAIGQPRGRRRWER